MNIWTASERQGMDGALDKLLEGIRKTITIRIAQNADFQNIINLLLKSLLYLHIKNTKLPIRGNDGTKIAALLILFYEKENECS